MSSDKPDVLGAAIRESIAAAVVGAVDGAKRDDILKRAVEGVIHSSGFSYEMQKQIEARAAAIVKEELAGGAYDGMLREAFRASLAVLAEALPAALTAAVVETVCGKSGDSSYDNRSGAMLPHLRREVDKRTAKK